MPKKAAFSSPVLTKEAKPQRAKSSNGGRRKKAAPTGPLVEYVRGPLRLNMAPVASAAPNDTSKLRHPKPKRRRPQAKKAVDINAGSVIGTSVPEKVAPPNGEGGGGGGGGKKRKRRRRKKKKSGNAANGTSSAANTATDSPIHGL